MCGYVLTFFGDWLVHASDVMVAMDENMYDSECLWYIWVLGK